MKRLIALLLVAAFVTISAVGCGGDTTKSGTTKTSSPSTGGTGAK